MSAPVVMLASRLERHAWTHGALVARLARALIARGREVTLLCDAAEDTAMFGCRVRARRAFEHDQAEAPTATARWLARMAQARAPGAQDAVTLSLTRLVPGEVWMPVDESAAALLADELGSRRTLSRAMWLWRHWGVLAGRRMERDAAADEGQVRAVLAFGPSAAAAAAGRWPRLAGRVRDIGFAAMVEPATGEAESRLRAEVRARLHINASRRVVLVSLMRTAGADWQAFLGAVARITAPEVRAGNAPVVVAMARDAYAVHDAACRAGCQRALRVVGQTERVDALLAAADAAAAPLGTGPDAFRAGATGRFIADALRAGRPVLSAPTASGVDLVAHRGVEAPGMVVEPTVEAWAEGLRNVCDDDWLAARAIGARAAGGDLGFEEWVGRVEAALDDR